MAAIPKLDQAHLQAVCDIIGDTAEGLTGSEIGRLLAQCGINDPQPAMTKRHRLFLALHTRQEKDGCSNNVVNFIQTVMNPVRFVRNPAEFHGLRGQLNEVLAFAGLHIGENGKVHVVTAATTLPEAQARAGSLRASLLQRNVHHDVLRFCRAELLQDNYFHAVFEATKSVAQKIRDKTGLAGDGADIVDRAFWSESAHACDKYVADRNRTIRTNRVCKPFEGNVRHFSKPNGPCAQDQMAH